MNNVFENLASLPVYAHSACLPNQHRAIPARAGNGLNQITLADLQLFADALDDLAPASRYRRPSAIKSLLAFGHRIGYLRFDAGQTSCVFMTGSNPQILQIWLSTLRVPET